MKYLQRGIHVTPIDVIKGDFKIKNWYDTSNAKDLVTGQWKVEKKWRHHCFGRYGFNRSEAKGRVII